MKSKEHPASWLKLFFFLIIILAGIILTFISSSFEICYKVNIDNQFIGYYKSYEDYENTYNQIEKEFKDGDLQIIKYNDIEPTLEKILVKEKILKQIDNYTLIENILKQKYIIYLIEINNEEKIYVSTEEKANQIVEEIKKEIGDNLKISIEKIETIDKNLLMDEDSLKKEKSDIIRKNILLSSRNTSVRTTEKQKYIWPTTSHTITSNYGYRVNPISKIYSLHTGLDIGVASNSPIFSVAEGTVTFASWNGGYGYQVKIQHKNGIITTYSHNNKLEVKKGDEVVQGQIIARSGSTGNSTGPHLHIEFIVNGNFKNPLDYL